MGCLIKMVKIKGGIKSIAFIRLEKAVKRDKNYKESEQKEQEKK